MQTQCCRGVRYMWDQVDLLALIKVLVSVFLLVIVELNTIDLSPVYKQQTFKLIRISSVFTHST